MEPKSGPDAAGGHKGGEGLLGGVMDAVRIHIRENGLQVGDWLPSEGTFAEKLGVSRGIVHAAEGHEAKRSRRDPPYAFRRTIVVVVP